MFIFKHIRGVQEIKFGERNVIYQFLAKAITVKIHIIEKTFTVFSPANMKLHSLKKY